MKRLLITGSRTWDDSQTIDKFLRYAVNHFSSDDVVLISGACPDGADTMCENWWEWNTNFPIERHPAKWGLFGKRAGFLRNEHMVNLGADLCIAFIKDGSKGATMTANLADEREIPVIRVNAVSL